MQIYIIKIQEEELEITDQLIEYYKKNTRKKRVTKKGIEKFFNAFVDKLQSRFMGF
jgi:hypothetical protein